VIFDMDGVVIDSEPLWQMAEVEVFGSVGVPLTTEMCKQTTGLRMDATVDYWYERHAWNGPAKIDVERRVKARVGELIALRGRAIEGAIELIVALRERGVPLAVCSSSPAFLIEAVCEKLAIREHFEFLQSAEDCVRGKPFPDPYIAAAAGLGQPPSRCVAIEDSLNGLRSAKAAGMRVVAFTGHRSEAVSELCDLQCATLRSLSAASVMALVP
jgi:mannitol-1-/sugar-/sorbitol-6-/2-deoxyglucose-6-phosphatase